MKFFFKVIWKTKTLGSVVTNNFFWEKNASVLVQKANTRMQLLQTYAPFTNNTEELMNRYVLFIRSILEKYCVLWHSSFTVGDSNDHDMAQKSLLKIILHEDYKD